MEEKDLKNKVITGSIWSILETFSLQIVQFVVGIILARILGPSEFGLIAMTGIFITLSNVISNGGFEKALIQQQKINELQINTVFYINLSLGIFLTTLIFIISPYIAIYFREPMLEPILQVLSFGIVLDAIGQTQRVLLGRELHFKKLSLIQITSSIASGSIGIILAVSGYGIWALVASSLTGTLTNVILFWANSTWYPKLQFSYKSITAFVPYGLNVLASSILFIVLSQFNTLIIGRHYTKTELGLYSRGEKLPDLLVFSLQNVIQKISFPVFARVQNDQLKFFSILKKSNKMYAFIAFPLLGFTFLDAKEIVLFLLTDKWLGCVIFLQLFCIAKIFDPLKTIAREALLAKGEANLLLKIFILSSAIELIPILIFISKGIIYVVWISIISHFIQYIIYIWAASEKLHFKMATLIKSVSPYLLAALASLLIVYLLSQLYPQWVSDTILLKLFIDFFLGSIIYFFIAYVWKFEEIFFKKNLTYFLSKK